MISFNPHLLYKNITDTLTLNNEDYTAANTRQMFVDKVNTLPVL